MKKTCKDIRREFIEFFQQRGHSVVSSSSLLPAEDPTLLFTNAGMNQFKDIFLGRQTPQHKRAANSQKCIRAGGKHNDLEDVGHDTYHHTFFEMLGNWSFGDYFKAEAIDWAWELLTKVWGLDTGRLHATYFGGDEAEGLAADTEARDLWLKCLSAGQVHPGNKKDNFWEMGDTGPCGPCSEIHYDFTPDLSGGPLVNKGDARAIEIWNLVFIQFNRGADGKLSPLPARHVDTGMGLERICRVLQGVDSNYDIDVFRGLFDAIGKLETDPPHPYRTIGAYRPYAGGIDDIKDIAYRVIADHIRALTFAIADGIIPSNEKRGSVLRSILRRAFRYGRQYLEIKGTFLYKLVPTVVELMGESYPEIAQRQKVVIDIIRQEEELFGKTLEDGIRQFRFEATRSIGEEIALKRGWTYKNSLIKGVSTDAKGRPTLAVTFYFTDAAGQEQTVRIAADADVRAFIKEHCNSRPKIPGEGIFGLHATYGFPVDLTRVMAEELGIEIDMEGYEKAMAEHREISAGTGDKFKIDAIANLPPTDDSAKYGRRSMRGEAFGWEIEESPEIEALRKMANDPQRAPAKVQIGSLSETLSKIVARLGVPVPAGTPEIVYRDRVVHAMRNHTDVTEDDIANLPQIVSQPDSIGATENTENLKRLWFVKQIDMDHLFIAVYGQQEGRLVMRGYYKGLPGSLLADLKNKGVPLEAVANSAVLSFDHPGSQPGLIGSKATPTSDTIATGGPEVKQNGEKTVCENKGKMPATPEIPPPIQAKVLGWVVGSEFQTSDELTEGAEAAVVLDRTNFYGEQGGQVGDSGVLAFDGGEFRVNNSVMAGQCVLHFGTVVKGRLKVGMTVTAHVDESRMDIMRNHTATHLLNWALREVLGDHVHQAGSIVAPDRLRFDFSHGQAMTAEELARVEAMVNDQVLKDLPISVAVMPLDEAKKVPGVRAVFGENYPDPVRVVMVQSSEPRPAGSGSSGPSTIDGQDRSLPVAARWIVSAEFCGGTHLSRTGQVGLFKIVSEESIAKGVRRITALTGKKAVEHVQQQDAILRAAVLALRCRPEELPDRVSALQREVKELKKRPAGGQASGDALTVVATLETPVGKVLIAQVATAEPEALRTLCDVQRQRGFVAIMIGGASEDKVTLVAMVDDALAKSGKLKAGDWVKAVAPVVDGGGGGKPTLAQAGGKKPDKLPEALQAAAKYAQEKLS